jgi:hypothetical protein
MGEESSLSTNELAKVLNDIRAYVRISASSSSKMAAKSAIDSWEKGMVYSKIDGKKTVQSIAETIGVPRTTINDWLEDFIQSGLASEPNEFYTNHRALFTLRELGIDLTQLKKKRVTKSTSTQSDNPSSPQQSTFGPDNPGGGAIERG